MILEKNNLNSKEKGGKTAFMKAIENNNIDALSMYLQFLTNYKEEKKYMNGNDSYNENDEDDDNNDDNKAMNKNLPLRLKLFKQSG